MKNVKKFVKCKRHENPLYFSNVFLFLRNMRISIILLSSLKAYDRNACNNIPFLAQSKKALSLKN